MKCISILIVTVFLVFGVDSALMVGLGQEDGQHWTVRRRLKERVKKRIEKKTRAECRESKMGSVPGTVEHSLKHDGLNRTFLLHLPSGYEQGKSVPLVLVLHGAGANGRITELLTGFSRVADKHGFAVVYPDAKPDGGRGSWQFWMGGADEMGDRLRAANVKLRARDDFGFIAALIDQLVADGVADRQRVYATGISNGAFMSNRLGCVLADRIAAIAPVSGTMSKRAAAETKPPRPMPVLYIHGTADKVMGLDGADRFTKRELSLSASDLVAWWVKHNECNPKPQVEQLPDSADDGTTVKRRLYEPKEGDAPVIYYEIDGGGHTWPSGSVQPERLLGKSCRDMDASAVIWEFFSKHHLAASNQ